MSSNVVVRSLSARMIHSWRFVATLSLVNPASEALFKTNDYVEN